MINHPRLLEVSQRGLRAYDDLPDITAPDWMPDPLVVQRQAGGQLLVAVGVKHLTEPSPENTQYTAVRDAFSAFELATRGLARAIIVEGNPREVIADPDEAYRQGSEPSMTVSLAAPYGMEQYCFEPERYGAQQLQEQGFRKEHIALYLWGRLLPVWARRMQAAEPSQRVDFGEWSTSRLAKLKAELGWAELDTYAGMAEIYQQTYGKPLDPENPETVQFMLEQTVRYMRPPTSPVQEVAFATNQERDLQLALGVADLWAKGYSIFKPFGYPHVHTLQDFLEGLRPNTPTGNALAVHARNRLVSE